MSDIKFNCLKIKKKKLLTNYSIKEVEVLNFYEVNRKIIDWLLIDDNPAVRYLTLKELLEEDEKSKIVIESVQKIMSYKPIVEILDKQINNRYWFNDKKDQNYRKYLGTFWQLLFLMEMQAQKNEQISNAIEHIFETGQAPNGGFSISGANSYAIECLTANMIRVLTTYNYLKDERTQNALEFLLKGFVDTNGETRCQTLGLLSNCYMVLPKLLHAFSLIPQNERTSRVEKGITLCVNRLLKNQIFIYLPEKNREFLKMANESKLKGQERINAKKKFFAENPKMKKITKKGWTTFDFPHSYTSDVLDTLRALKSANIKYSQDMDIALGLVKEKAVNGIWINESKFKSPMYTTIEQEKQKSKWITFHALSVLKFYEGISII